MKSLRKIPILCAIPRIWDLFLDLFQPDPEDSLFTQDQVDELLESYNDDIFQANEHIKDLKKEVKDVLKSWEKLSQEKIAVERQLREKTTAVPDLPPVLQKANSLDNLSKNDAIEALLEVATEVEDDDIISSDIPEALNNTADELSIEGPKTIGSTVQSSPFNVAAMRKNPDIKAAKEKKKASKKKAKRADPGKRAIIGQIRKDGTVRGKPDYSHLYRTHWDRIQEHYRHRQVRFDTGVDNKLTTQLQMCDIINTEFGMNKCPEVYANVFRGKVPRNSYPEAPAGRTFPWEEVKKADK